MLPGLVVVALLALAAEWLDRWTGILGTASWCIILGASLSIWPRPMHVFRIGSKWAEKFYLQAAIALMGLQISLGQIREMWLPALLFLAVALCLMLLASVPLPKVFDGVDRKTRWLLAAGESVCGSAAIAALSGPTRATSKDAAASILVVNLLSTLGLILIPLLLSSVDSSSMDSAWWTGGYLQSAGHALAAGFSMGEESGLWATAFKMERILLLVPLLWMSRMVFSNEKVQSQGPNALPAFIWIFLAVLILNHFWPMPRPWKANFHFADQKLIHMALCAIGLNIDLRSLFRSMPPLLGFGLLLTAVHLILLFFGRLIWTIY
jgi:uncharacterized integral membrane protein (TIGR00698 family)